MAAWLFFLAAVSPALSLSASMIREGCEGVSLLQLGFSPKKAMQTLEASVLELPTMPLGLVAVLRAPYNHIAVNVTYHNLREEVLTFPERRPREFNVMLATLKTWSADFVVQMVEKRRGTAWCFDYKRSAVFAIFGFLYIGITQWFLYVSLLTSLFPDAIGFANAPLADKLTDTTGQMDMVGQIFVDNFIFEVFIYFPVFYIIKAFMQGSKSVCARVETGLSKYRGNIVSDNLASCAIWIPADVIIFAMPMYLRMPLEHGVSFGWTMFMSAMRGADEKPHAKAETKCEKSVD